MIDMELNIIYSDKSIVVVEKPVGVPSQPDKTGDADMQTMLLEKFNYAGVVHRLDRPVGGLMVYAMNKKAEAALSAEMAKNEFGKTYYAVCCGKPKETEGTLTDWLVKNQRLNVSSVVNKGTKGAKEAILDYTVIKSIEDEKNGCLSLLKIALHTGRHHQIRVQTAHAGIPLWGDTKYNPEFKRGYYNVSPALYSGELKFTHPDTGERV
ncbi:MAG: RluA family pseudouridine synthase, partial [Clostridiales bacterium]|nr:RluA family pseudouridine synthase [Clostridiales bacterium]